MTELTPAELAIDQYVDLLLRGAAPTPEEFAREHPELAPADVARLAKLARTLGKPSQAAAGAGELPFESLGSYRILARLGAGGMGIVYEAEDARLGRRVALKVVRPELAGSPDTLARFEREARAIARLRHPNIVTVFEAGEERGVPFLAMEFVPGASLDARFAQARSARSRVPLQDLLRWARDVARALAAAHEAGIVHRDVKPSNVRVTPEGSALLLDFGLALDPDSATISRTGQMHGTLFYASPEQISGRGAKVDARTDVWSLGVLLYEGVTGRVPFEGAHSEEVLLRILQSEPVAPRDLAPDVSRDVETVVLTALEKERERRYASAAELADDLDALLEGRPIRARPSGALTKAWKWSRRRPAHAAAIALSLALVVGGPVIWAIVQQRHASALKAESELARAQQELAESRARDLESMAQFQGRVLARIQPKVMGAHVVSELFDEAREAWARDGATPLELDARRQELERLLESLNATNVAVAALRADVLEPAVTAAHREFEAEPRMRGMVLHSLAQTCWVLGVQDLALTTQQSAWDAIAPVADSGDRDRLAVQANLGFFLFSAGRLDEAETHLRAAAEGLIALHGPDDDRVSNARSNLGMLLRRLDRRDEAESIDREILATRRRKYGDDAPETLTSMSNLGAALLQQGKVDEAEPLLREAYERRRRILGPAAEPTLSTANNLAVLYRDARRLADAERVFDESSAAAIADLGDRHPLTGFLLAGMGEVIAEQGCLDLAESTFRRALRASTEAVGANHDHTLYAASKLGSLLRRTGRWREAEDVLSGAYESAVAALGGAHPDVRLIATQWAALLVDQGRCAEAWLVTIRMRDAARAQLGPANERVQRYTADLARMLTSGGALDEAREEVEFARAALPEGRKPASALVDAAVIVYEARQEVEASAENLAALARWRAFFAR
ncbi:MAG: serine/threonine protein kinase [Planctomycetes bacterium]|nr:serine/threonine protein kinase [Planctomycetota bacterium]